MRVIALNRFYRPDHSATSQLLGDLAEYVATRGHAVTVIASRLRYEGGELLPKRETLAGVSIRRIATTRFGRANLVGRAFDYLSFYVSAFFCLLVVGRKGDVLIIKTDPPLITIPATLAARLKGMITINWCQDLFPEVAGSLGMSWAEGWFGGLLRRLRNRSLRRASRNAVLHETMGERLAGQGLDSGLLEVIPNWADRDIRPLAAHDNPLRQAWGLENKVVIGYSGNLGRAHMPATIAQLVAGTAHIEGLVWLFIGGGAGLETVRRAAAGAGNVMFKPYQPREALSESLSVPDIHLVSLDPACEGSIVPSKVYGVRAADRPVLFLGAADGATARDFAPCNAGWVLDPDKPETWEPVLTRLVDDHRQGIRTQMSPAWRNGWSSTTALARWTRVLEDTSREARHARPTVAPSVAQ